MGVFDNFLPSHKPRTLEDLVNVVKECFKMYNPKLEHVPFTIAGGAVFSILNGNQRFNDIDVYFHNKLDFEKVVSEINNPDYKTKNATTVAFRGNRIQLIEITCGKPKEVFATFDINCSACGITSDYEVLKDDVFSDNIEINFDNVRTTTLKRVTKYIREKNAKDTNNKSLISLYEHLLDNFEEQIPSSYECEQNRLGRRILNSHMHTEYNNDTIHTLIHDTIVNHIEPTKRLNVFERLDRFHVFDLSKLPSPCDEVRVFKYLYEIENIDPRMHSNKTDMKRIMMKYPEYFI